MVDVDVTAPQIAIGDTEIEPASCALEPVIFNALPSRDRVALNGGGLDREPSAFS